MYLKYLKEVEQKVKDASKSYKPVTPTLYNSNYMHIAAIPVPKQREISREGFSFSNLSETENLKVWSYIWNNSKYFEVMNQALLYMERYKGEMSLSHWKVLKPWSTRIDNWAHGDSLCCLYAELHEKYSRDVLPTFQKWNGSRKPWLRRLSIVSLFYYSALRKTKQPSFSLALRMVKPLLRDEHFYVQKGFGWTLREMYNVYPEATLKYLKEIASDIPPAGWQAATEKLNRKDKGTLKKLRKAKKGE